MKGTAPHLLPALTALLLVATALTGGYLYARHVERRFIHALAPERPDSLPLKIQGSVLQREAFAQPDLLPIYGSSELELRDPYHASIVFEDYPTDFTVFPVGRMGAGSLCMLQMFAAIGSDLEDKKVAISITPPPFFRAMNPRDSYQGNFSALQASALAFSTDLSFSIKQQAARRMLDYPQTLEGQTLTRFALRRLAEGTAMDRFLYYTLVPLGKLQNLVFNLQDHWNTLLAIVEKSELDSHVERKSGAFNWQAMAVDAESRYRRLADNNPFGMAPNIWARDGARLSRQVNAYPGGTFPLVRVIRQMAETIGEAKEWTDLELLLRALGELGARPLVLSSPMKGPFYAYWAVPQQARRLYYDRFRRLIKDCAVPALDFADHDGDTYFTLDASSHISSKGWVYYCRALDAFYHAVEVADARALIADLPPGPGPAPDGRRGPIPDYEGIHHVNGPTFIGGWVWDSTKPDAPVSVDIYDGDQRLATVVADRFNQALVYAGKGNGKHSFAYRVPERLRDGTAHMIRVQIAGTTLDLKNTPRLLEQGKK
jgi:D-alanine transfer protein